MNFFTPDGLLAQITQCLDIALLLVTRNGQISFSSWPRNNHLPFKSDASQIESLLTTMSVAPEAQEKLFDFLRIARPGEQHTLVFQHLVPEDNSYSLQMSATILSADSEPADSEPAAAIQIRDITVENLLYSKIEDLERVAAAGQMAAGIAHEFNNILTAMMGWTQLAIRSCDGNQPALDALTTIDNNMQRARKIASDLLEIARPLTTTEFQTVSLDQSVREALKLLSWDLSNAHIRVYATIHETPPCRGSMTRMIQVFINIIRNAIDATPSFGSLEVVVTRQGEHIVASFADTGTGIADDDLPHLFRPFYSTKVQGGRIQGGNGLGLSVSRRIIEESGGTITLQNREQGGTLVTVTLPITEDIPDRNSAPSLPSSVPPGVVVLVVDDEPDICEMIRTALSLRGACVITATDGEEALTRCRQELFNAAFVDYAMNGLSGHDLGRAIHEIQPDLPIIYMSGIDIPSSGDDDINAFLRKPFHLNEIQIQLRRALDASGHTPSKS